MEPMTSLSYKFFKQINLVELARIIATNYASNWQALPFAPKVYNGFAWQFFVKIFCAAGHSSLLAMNYFDNLKKFCKS